MHYANGREAKPGDPVIMIGEGYQKGEAGIVYDVMPGSDTCNARLATKQQGDPTITLKECLHLEDAAAILKEAVDKQKEKEFSSKV